MMSYAVGGVQPCPVPVDGEFTRCFFCGKGGCGHFYGDFDAYVHARCFLRDLYSNPMGLARLAFAPGSRVYLDTTADRMPL